jgi:hypothetical protein
MATVLMIIAPERFRDEELFVTKEELEKAGHKISSACKRGSDWPNTPDPSKWTCPRVAYCAIMKKQLQV